MKQITSTEARDAELHPVRPPADNLTEAVRSEFERWATKAGPVTVWRCIFPHSEERGCHGVSALGCAEHSPEARVRARIEPAYTAQELRKIQRVEWDAYFNRRRIEKGTRYVSPDR